MQDIFDDEFRQQDFATQQTVANNYFDAEMADDEFKALPQEKQDSIKQNYVSENTRSFDEIMYQPQGKPVTDMFGEGSQTTFADTQAREVTTLFPDAQEGSTLELQHNIQVTEDKQALDQGVFDFYSKQITDADKALNTDLEHYKTQNLENRIVGALDYFQKNVKNEEFDLLADEQKMMVMENFYSNVVKPKKEEGDQQHNFTNALWNFADKVLHTVTDDSKHQDLSMAREFQQSQDETLAGQGAWLGGSVAPYMAGGIAAGTIRSLTPALLTDSAMQASLSFLEHGGKSDWQDNVLRDIAIDTGVNLATFGVVRKLIGNKLSKGDVDGAAQSYFGKNADQLNPQETAKMDEFQAVVKEKVVKSAVDNGMKETDLVKFEDELSGMIDTDVVKPRDEVITRSPQREAGLQRAEAKRMQLEKEFGADEDAINAGMRVLGKKHTAPTVEQAYKGISEDDLKRIDDSTPLETSPPVSKEDIKEANRIFLRPETLGATAGFEQNEDGTYTYNIEKGLLGAVGAKLAHKTLTSNQVKKIVIKYMDDIEEAAMKAAGGGTPPKPFYSVLEDTIVEKMPRRASVKQIKGILKNVKADEMKWSGVDEFLEGKDVVTKDELLEAISQPKLERVTHEALPLNKEAVSYQIPEVKKIADKANSKDDFVTILENDYEAFNSIKKAYGKNTVEDEEWALHIGDELYGYDYYDSKLKFKDYTTKDIGTNYREELVTLADKQKQRIEDIGEELISLKSELKKLKENPKSEYNWLDDMEGRGQTKENNKAVELSETISRLEKERNTINNGEDGLSYRSAHWDEPNVLYHTRKQDTKIDGKNTLLVEEIQSDWHQAGRKSGYKNLENSQKMEVLGKQESDNINELREVRMYKDVVTQPLDRDTLNKIQKSRQAKDGTIVFTEHINDIDNAIDTEATYKNLLKKEDSLYVEMQDISKNIRELNELGGVKGVPQAPYSKTWQEKAMKDIIAEAVEKDYDRVAWVAGKEQAQRYSLSDQVNSVEAYKNKSDKWNILVDTKKQGEKDIYDLTDEQLADNIGKEMAQKIIKDNGGYYKGDGLEVGGEGMKTFYDSILPKWTNKYIKKYGSKVEVKKLDNGQEVWSFNITPEMKGKVSTQGQALYTSPTAGGAVVGSGAGLETDDEGNITFDPKKALIGALGGAAFGYGAGKLYNKAGRVANVPKGQLPPETKFQKAQRIAQDKFNRVAQMQEVKAGADLPDSMNPYQAEELFHGRAETRMNNFREKIVEPLMKKISKSDNSLDDLDEYLQARHASERNAKMFEVSGIENGSGMSNAEAEAILVRLDTPQMQQMAKYVDAMNKTRLSLLRKEGLESDEFIDMIAGTYEHYTPLMRDMSDEFGSVVTSTGKGFDIKGKEFKRAKGSHRAVESPTMHSIIKFQESLVRSEKNKVGKAFLNFIEEFPDSSLYEVQGLKYTPRYDKSGNIIQLDPAYKLKDNVMHVKIDGKIKQITIHDEALARAFKNLAPSQLKYGLQYAHKAVRFLAGMSTSYNPEFIFSNFTRDIQTAMMNVPSIARPSRAKMAVDVFPSIKGIKTGKGQWGDLYKEFASEGGKTGWMDSTDIGDLSEALFKDIEMHEGKRPIRKATKGFLDFIDSTNNAVENGIRLVVYKQAKEAGLTNKKAASIAKNLTVNFNRKGELGTVLNTAYMFANASVQGTARMAKALSTSGKAQTGAAILAGTGLSLHLYNMSVDEENYKLVPQYIKDTNYVVMKDDGSGEYYKLPLPYGYNMLKTIGDIAGEAITGDLQHDVVSRALGAAVNAFSPIGVGADPVHTITPTLGKLPYELQTNQNFFGGMIRPDPKAYGADDVPDSHKSFKSVNPLLKQSAEKLNELTGGTAKTEGAISVSPETIEHIMEFVSGGLGKLASNTFASTTQAIKGEEVDANKIPFKRRVKGKVHEKAELYKARDILERSGKSIVNKRDTTEFNRYIQKALKDKDIDAQYYQKLSREFHRNQAEVQFYRDNDIQGKLTPKQEKGLNIMLYNRIYKNPKFKYGKGTITQMRNKIRKAR